MSKRVYGIDLGTTYSCIAYVDEHGKPVVIPNSESQPTTPSVVYFETPDNVVVGMTAKENAAIHSDRVVSTIKRSMGDPNFELEFHGKGYKPADISSFILRRLADDAATATGDKVEDVIITCPAYFGVAEKEATRQAGVIAGLNPLYIIPEPTAAAVAYGFDDTRNQTILVYDLGGGTFDVTIISLKTGEIAVVATGGDHTLGGKNWDEALVDYFAQAFEEATGTPAHELQNDMETYQELLNAAERVKVRLSTSKTATHKVRHKTAEAKVDVTRDKFDEITRDLLERTISMTKEMLEEGKRRGVERIDKMLLVGGSTYMPQVLERVKEFPFEAVQFDPNQAVAKGAAIFGYRCELIDKIRGELAKKLGKTKEEIDIETVSPAIKAEAEKTIAAAAGMTIAGLSKVVNKKIINVSSQSFGLIVINKEGREVVSNLVVKNDQVPRDVSRRFGTHAPGQTEVELRVMQNQQVTGPDESVELSLCVPETPIGTATLMFDRALPADSPVEVTFSLAADGLLSVHGRDLTTGREIKGEFKTEAVRSKEELAQAKSKALAMSVSA